MRVVCDTNVLISGLFWKGPPKRIFDLIEKGSISICLTPRILDELLRVLRYPRIFKHLAAAGVTPEDIVSDLLASATVFPDEPFVRVVKDDPSDDVFINCALSSGARWLISGDQHLLRLVRFGNIRIITPSQFLKLL